MNLRNYSMSSCIIEVAKELFGVIEHVVELQCITLLPGEINAVLVVRALQNSHSCINLVCLCHKTHLCLVDSIVQIELRGLRVSKGMEHLNQRSWVIRREELSILTDNWDVLFNLSFLLEFNIEEPRLLLSTIRSVDSSVSNLRGLELLLLFLLNSLGFGFLVNEGLSLSEFSLDVSQSD